MNATLDRPAPPRSPRTARPAPPSPWTGVALAAAWLAIQASQVAPAWAQAGKQAPSQARAKAAASAASAAAAPASSASGATTLLTPEVLSSLAAAAQSTPSATSSRLNFSLNVPSGALHNGQEPLFFEADHLEGEAGQRTRATGDVRLRQGDLSVRADELTHTQGDNSAKALGHVHITRLGNIFAGPELSLQLDTLQGEFVQPRFWFARTQAGGQAELVEFLGENRLRATRTTYSSCTPENTADGSPGEPDWALKTSRVYLDFGANEGVADNAVIWFKGVPILAAPKLTFPLNDQRKSGWLPPSFDYDSNSGFELSAPYYWNIAPDQDMTLAPTLSVKRGIGLDTEYRYLGASDEGVLHVVGLPDDRVAMRSRGLLDFKHMGRLQESGAALTHYDLRWRRVSDDDYWKDFPHGLPTLTPRLYDSHAHITRELNARNWGLGDSQTTLYGGVQNWQVLRDLDTSSDASLSNIEAPYRREPQLGIKSRSGNDTGVVWSLQGEFNRFTHEDPNKPRGNRLHAAGDVARTFNLGGLNLTPRLGLNSTSYDMDQPLSNNRRSATRTLPTLSVDSAMTLERPVHLFNQDLTQTLEPRLLYVRTAYRDQSRLPIFDSAPRDFNQYAIYSENAYTGVDRISDANQITLGVTSRLINEHTGAEALRLGVVQKMLLADQRINPDGDEPITQRLSDLLLLGSTSVIPHWTIDSFMQFGAQNHATQRGLLSLRYSPGAWRTVSAAYRYTRGASEQFDLGWQWPIGGQMPAMNPVAQVRSQALDDPLNLTGQRATSARACGGTWYGVGRLSYSLRDTRLTDSLLGIEYDAGCWIGRVVAERVSVGRTQASTRLMFQLELSGLSRISLGSNPLRALKENIPGYRLLQDDSTVAPTTGSLPAPSDD